jgi:L-asparaginase II
MDAALANPGLLATTGRFAAGAMAALEGRALVKSGAEGVYIAAMPAAGIGVALKIDDGGQRGAEAVMAGILSALFPDAANALSPWANGPVNTVLGVRVGDNRATGLDIPAL